MPHSAESRKEKNQKKARQTFYARCGKRYIDFTFALIAFILLSPILVVLAILVRIKHGTPVLFSPTRPGMNEKIFHLHKFRSMSNAKDADGILLPEKDRLTKFGKILRATSLDELPELLNIIKGDMSIVGPRPLPMKYLPYYSEEQRGRHSVRPGLTGLAQISGRNNLPWNQRFDTDLDYVHGLSLKNDIAIVWKTVSKVFKREDVIVPGDTAFYQFDTYRVLETEGSYTGRNPDTTWGEIGSNFWIEEEETGQGGEEGSLPFPSTEDGTLTVSGRAAVTLALRDISSRGTIGRAWLPSVCSFPMVQPFIQAGIPYSFYSVILDGNRTVYELEGGKTGDVVLVMSLYGLDRGALADFTEGVKKKGCTVIEDITHSYLSRPQCTSTADYYVASLRKWLAIPAGGWVGKRKGALSAHPDLDGQPLAEKPLSAMREKRKYIHGETNDKESYLIGFTSFESDLVQTDSMLKLDGYSTDQIRTADVDRIRRIRRENALALIRGLVNVEGVATLCTEDDLKAVVPLFVPILVNNESDRDRLQEYLRKAGVFCPVTWPETMGAPSGFRKRELSLICDQRYGMKDMQCVVRLIREYFERSGGAK